MEVGLGWLEGRMTLVSRIKQIYIYILYGGGVGAAEGRMTLVSRIKNHYLSVSLSLYARIN